MSSPTGYLNINAAGTAAIRTIPSHIKTITIGAPYVGTVVFFDTSATAGTAAGNAVLTVGTPSAVPVTLKPNLSLSKGITYAATGTPVITLGFD